MIVDMGASNAYTRSNYNTKGCCRYMASHVCIFINCLDIGWENVGL